jgi:hypothetical protein
MSTITSVSLTDVVPAPRRPADDDAAPRRQHPAEQYWSVFEACWVVVRGGLQAAVDPR